MDIKSTELKSYQNKILSGKNCANYICKQIKTKIDAFLKKGIKPKLAVIVSEKHHSSNVYVSMKIAKANELGIDSIVKYINEDSSEEDIIQIIEDWNNNPDIHGVFVQLPIPKHIDKSRVINAINPNKDVDGLTPTSLGKLAFSMQAFVCAAPKAVIELIDYYKIETKGKKVLIIGTSNIVGKPLALMLLERKATVTCAHIDTLDLPTECRNADIICTATGNPEFIRKEWIKKDAVIIDVGYSRIPEINKDVGDVKFEEAIEVASKITPVPGGIGPITVACLMDNIVTAVELQNNI